MPCCASCPNAPARKQANANARPMQEQTADRQGVKATAGARRWLKRMSRGNAVLLTSPTPIRRLPHPLGTVLSGGMVASGLSHGMTKISAHVPQHHAQCVEGCPLFGRCVEASRESSVRGMSARHEACKLQPLSQSQCCLQTRARTHARILAGTHTHAPLACPRLYCACPRAGSFVRCPEARARWTRACAVYCNLQSIRV